MAAPQQHASVPAVAAGGPCQRRRSELQRRWRRQGRGRRRRHARRRWRGGGGRRSDVNAKHDIALIGRLDNGLGFYRYSYNGSDKAYVGVMAQEVQTVMPDAVVRGRDGYLRVYYEKLGLKFETYDHWVASGARIPSAAGMRHTQIQFW